MYTAVLYYAEKPYKKFNGITDKRDFLDHMDRLQDEYPNRGVGAYITVYVRDTSQEILHCYIYHENSIGNIIQEIEKYKE